MDDMEDYSEREQERANGIYENSSPGDDNQNNQNPSTENLGSTIKKGESTYGVPTSEINMTNDINIIGYYPYEDGEEIPVIKLKDENYFKYNQQLKEIKPYLETLEKIIQIEDSKFSMCIYHRYNSTDCTDFCINCNKNLCQNCKENCLQKNHDIINLEGMKIEIKNEKIS